MTNRARWEEMTGAEKKLEASKAKAKQAPVGDGLVKKAVKNIGTYQERQRKALEEAGAL
jgi:hypothetical protein